MKQRDAILTIFSKPEPSSVSFYGEATLTFMT